MTIKMKMMVILTMMGMMMVIKMMMMMMMVMVMVIMMTIMMMMMAKGKWSLWLICSRDLGTRHPSTASPILMLMMMVIMLTTRVVMLTTMVIMMTTMMVLMMMVTASESPQSHQTCTLYLLNERQGDNLLLTERQTCWETSLLRQYKSLQRRPTHTHVLQCILRQKVVACFQKFNPAASYC